MARGRIAAVGSSLLVGLLLAAIVGCAADDPVEPSAAPPAEVVEQPAATADVRIDGPQVVLLADGDEHVVAELGDADGEAVHASLRPTTSDRHTVLVLTRVVDGPARYELRYVTVDLSDEGVRHTDLYWFPWRSQVDEVSAAVLDVPPIPVWSPDGTGLAWLEWTDDGTRLRTVGWFTDGTADNPSDEVATYRLDDVPAGSQLERWLPAEQQLDAVLVARGTDDARYRIEVAGDAA